MEISAHKITFRFILLMSTFSLQNCTGKPVMPPAPALRNAAATLWPYLDENGRYGYADKKMKLAIPAKYSSATPFTTTGFAVVSEVSKPLYKHHNYYGVINQEGTLVIPYAYEAIHLEVLNGQTLIWTNHAYRNRWRFWDWGGILFGDNFLSGAKLIDTEVWRSELKLRILETGQTINNKRTYERAQLLEALPFETVDSSSFLQGDRLYQLRDGKAVCIAKNIYGTANGFLLQQQGTQYRLIDQHGHAVSDATYKKRKSLRIRIADRELLFPVKNIEKTATAFGTGQLRYVFQDKQGRQYLFPDFETPFPNRVDAVAEGNVAMDTVLNRSRLYPDRPGSGRFYFRWNYVLAERGIFETDKSGIWKRYSSAQFDPKKAWRPGVSKVVPNDHIPQGWRVTDQEATGGGVYCITLEKGARDTLEQRMGLWDSATQSWVWAPVNYSIHPLDIKKGYWKYQEEQMGKYGLYHVSGSQKVTRPLYDEVFPNGWVRVEISPSEQLEFFVDQETGKAYCAPAYLREL